MNAAERKAYKAHVLAWLDRHGVAATGAALSAALTGERHLPTLYRANMADGVAVRESADGRTLVGAVTDGDVLDGIGTVIADPVRDPETGAYWLTVRTTRRAALMDDYDAGSSETTDVELSPSTAVTILPKPRTLAPWLVPAHEAYKADRAAWEERADAWTNGYSAERAAYVDETIKQGKPDPAPRWADYVKQAAAEHTHGQEQAATHDAA